MESEIHWKPMTGGRMIPSQLPCITFKEVERDGYPYYLYKKLDANAIILRRWGSRYGPRFPTMDGLPVLQIPPGV